MSLGARESLYYRYYCDTHRNQHFLRGREMQIALFKEYFVIYEICFHGKVLQRKRTTKVRVLASWLRTISALAENWWLKLQAEVRREEEGCLNTAGSIT